MSFLRALRAYIGLGPDDEIEDRYLSELNARRRELSLDEIRPRSGGEPGHDDYGLDLGSEDQFLDGYGDLGDLDGFDDGVEVRPRGPGDRSRPGGWDRAGGVDRTGEVDEIDLTGGEAKVRRSRRSSAAAMSTVEASAVDMIESRNRASGERSRRPGRHDIEPEEDLESIVDGRGREAVQVRVWSGETADGSTGAVVRSLDSMRAKPRTLMPESFAEAKLVADEFKRGVPVVLNLQAIERDLARRLIDFASGICYVLDGSMEKIASQVFLLIPEAVEVSDEDRRRIEERGYAR